MSVFYVWPRRKFACPFKLLALLERLANREHKPDGIGICCVGYCAEDEKGENPEEKHRAKDENQQKSPTMHRYDAARVND